MAKVLEGDKFLFSVVGKNKAGRVVPLTDATVTLSDPNLGSVSVNPDGTNGVFVAGSTDGSLSMTATAAGVSSDPFLLDVVSDQTVSTVEVVPADITVSSVAIVA